MNDINHEDESELQSVELYDKQMILQLSFTDDNKQRVMFTWSSKEVLPSKTFYHLFPQSRHSYEEVTSVLPKTQNTLARSILWYGSNHLEWAFLPYSLPSAEQIRIGPKFWNVSACMSNQEILATKNI